MFYRNWNCICCICVLYDFSEQFSIAIFNLNETLEMRAKIIKTNGKYAVHKFLMLCHTFLTVAMTVTVLIFFFFFCSNSKISIEMAAHSFINRISTEIYIVRNK